MMTPNEIMIAAKRAARAEVRAEMRVSRAPKPDGFHWEVWRDGKQVEGGSRTAAGFTRHELTTLSDEDPVARGLSVRDAQAVGQYLLDTANGK